ncbi:MAG: hypothetical protein RLZZ225_1218 [Pseudomonadota bacterium]
MDNQATDSIEKKRSKLELLYKQQLIQELEQLNTLIAHSDSYPDYPHRQQIQLLRLNELKMAHETAHRQIIRSKPCYKNLFAAFPNWQSGKKEWPYQLKEEEIEHGVEELLDEFSSDKTGKWLSDFFETKPPSTLDDARPSTSNATSAPGSEQASASTNCARKLKSTVFKQKLLQALEQPNPIFTNSNLYRYPHHQQRKLPRLIRLKAADKTADREMTRSIPCHKRLFEELPHWEGATKELRYQLTGEKSEEIRQEIESLFDTLESDKTDELFTGFFEDQANTLDDDIPSSSNAPLEQRGERIAQGAKKLLDELAADETDKLLAGFFENKSNLLALKRNKYSTSSAASASENQQASTYTHKKFGSL